MSADEPGIPIKSREQLYDEMRGEDLMPHAPKMQLRHEEEDGLELVSHQDQAWILAHAFDSPNLS